MKVVFTCICNKEVKAPVCRVLDYCLKQRLINIKWTVLFQEDNIKNGKI